MRASDLMIGDWVCYDGDTDYSYPIKIEGMDASCDSCITSDRDDVGFEGVVPIPLTAEILEKNGYIFVKDSNISISSTKLLDVRTSIHFQYCNSDICFAQLSHSGAGSYELRKYIRYVHELQHALKMFELTELSDNLII